MRWGPLPERVQWRHVVADQRRVEQGIYWRDRLIQLDLSNHVLERMPPKVSVALTNRPGIRDVFMRISPRVFKVCNLCL